MTESRNYVVIPNWNGKDMLISCLDSLLRQNTLAHIVVVDNGSADGSQKLIKEHYPSVHLIELDKNYGFAGGVNAGIKVAVESGAEFVALFNNDAVAHNDWLSKLVGAICADPKVGIVTSKFMRIDKKHIDSTGDFYTIWGLPLPRGRNELDTGQFDNMKDIFSASGGASLYRISMLNEIGLFDNDFFAYYEDVDLSFRAQLAGWKIRYEPGALAYHQVGATSSKLKGFATYQTMKNLPLLLWKNVPRRLLLIVLPRFTLSYFSFYISSLQRGQGWVSTKGILRMLFLLPKKSIERVHIQKNRTVSDEYIKSILYCDLPPDAIKLRVLRAHWWKLIGKKQTT